MKRLSCEIVVLVAAILSGGLAFADTINYVGTATLWKFSDNDKGSADGDVESGGWKVHYDETRFAFRVERQ